MQLTPPWAADCSVSTRALSLVALLLNSLYSQRERAAAVSFSIWIMRRTAGYCTSRVEVHFISSFLAPTTGIFPGMLHYGNLDQMGWDWTMSNQNRGFFFRVLNGYIKETLPLPPASFVAFRPEAGDQICCPDIIFGRTILQLIPAAFYSVAGCQIHSCLFWRG